MRLFNKFFFKKNNADNPKNEAGAIKQTLEFSTRDFPFLSIQFLVFGIIFFIPKILYNYANHIFVAELTSYILWIPLIPLLVYHILTRNSLKKRGIYTFQLYDAWGFVWFLVGFVSFAVCTTADILSSLGKLSENISAGIFLISGIFEVLIASVMLMVTGFILKKGVIKAVSIWIMLIMPFMLIRVTSKEAFIHADKVSYALRDLTQGVNEIKILLCTVYIIIGLCYIGRRQAVLNGVD